MSANAFCPRICNGCLYGPDGKQQPNPAIWAKLKIVKTDENKLQISTTYSYYKRSVLVCVCVCVYHFECLMPNPFATDFPPVWPYDSLHLANVVVARVIHASPSQTDSAREVEMTDIAISPRGDSSLICTIYIIPRNSVV